MTSMWRRVKIAIRSHWKAICLVLGIIFLYRDSFFSSFFQDDRLQLDMARSGNWLATVPNNNHFHPISIQLFYSLGDLLTPNNPFGFHFILFLVFIATMKLFYDLSYQFLKDKNKAFLAVIFYSFNLSIFANFYWIANSHFALAPLFALLTIFFYQKKSRLSGILTPVSFLLGLGSNELFYIFPVGLLLYAFFTKNLKIGRLVSVLVADVIAVILRLLLLHLPTQSAYRFTFDLRVLKTIQWYLLRVVNLPEGIRNKNNLILYVFLVILLSLISISFYKLHQKRGVRWPILIFGTLWFLIFGLTFFLLPNHMSAHYLSTSLFGPVLIFAEILSGKKLTLAVIITYLLMSYFGLEFLKATHWIILKNTGPIGTF